LLPTTPPPPRHTVTSDTSQKEHTMINARNALIFVGLAFATWETVNIFWISFPAAAVVMAALFLISTIWFWRRDSLRAAVALLLLCAFEGVIAPTLNAMTVTKAADLALAVTGVALGTAVIVGRRRKHPSQAVQV
jgi:FtsH-binding integral membrane protein